MRRFFFACVALAVMTAGIVPAGSAAKEPPARVHYALRVYRLDKAGRNEVLVDPGTYRSYYIRWWEGKTVKTQTMTSHGEWRLSDDPETDYRPRALPWPGGRAIVLIAKRPASAYDVRAPLVYVLRNRHWRLANPDPERESFTDRGAFFLRRDRLYVWDYAMDDEHSHRAPQRYWLKTFRLSRTGKLFRIGKKMTRRLYPDVNELDYMPPQHIPIRYDPLREFGMRWRWWGE